MKLWLCALLVVLPLRLLAQPGAGCSATRLETGRRLERSLEVGGLRRTYILDVPDSIQAGAAVPVLLDFHGFGHSGAGVWKVSGFKILAERDPFITVYPDGLNVHLLQRDGPGWDIFRDDGNREVAFVRALLADLETRYCIDSRRIFSTGFSNGGFLSHLLACVLADRIAAIAPVGGGDLDRPCPSSRPVPAVIHHGRNDTIVPVERARALRDRWVKRNACSAKSEHDGCEWHRNCENGADVAYCEDDGQHHWPSAATERIWRFFREHPMPPAATPSQEAPPELGI